MGERATDVGEAPDSAREAAAGALKSRWLADAEDEQEEGAEAEVGIWACDYSVVLKRLGCWLLVKLVWVSGGKVESGSPLHGWPSYCPLGE